MTTDLILEIKEEIIAKIMRGWQDDNPKGRSNDWYAYCDNLGLKKSPHGGWMVETEAELTMIMLKIK